MEKGRIQFMGALSLLSLSDQLIFFAYPNQENIEGLNAAFQLVSNAGKKRNVVVMSKVVATDEGIHKAERLFHELNIVQEEMLPIFYNQEMALSGSSPFSNMRMQNPYIPLSEYITDGERAYSNMALLANGKKEKLLQEVFQQSKQMIILEDIQKFKNEKAYLLLKYHFKEELYGLNSQISAMDVRVQDMVVPVPLFTLVANRFEENCDLWMINESGDFERIGLELLLPVFRASSLKRNLMQELPEGNADTIRISDLLDALAYKAPRDKIWPQNILGQQNSMDSYPVTAELQIIINISENMLRNNAGQVVKNIKGLTTLYNKGKGKIQFKFLIDAAVWNLYPEMLAALKGNILEVNISKSDILRYLVSNLNMKTFQHDVAQKYVQDTLGWDESRLYELLEMVIGIRENMEVYSGTVFSYLYESLRRRPSFRYDELLDCLKEAARQELENPGSMYADRLIGFDKIQCSIEQRDADELPMG